MTCKKDKNVRILLCGPRTGKVVTGVALALDLLASGLRSSSINFRIVDASFWGDVSKSGTFSLRRSLETILVIFAVWWNLLFCQIYYATMSTSAFGFVRDYLTVGFAKLFGHRTVLHLHGGGFEDFYTSQQSWLRSLIRSNLRRTDTIIVLGELLKDQFYCVGEFVKPKLKVIPNGLTIGVDEPNPVSRKLLSEEKVELLYLSSLMPSKGFFDVIQAIVLLEKQKPGKYHLNLCGSFMDAKTETEIEVNSVETLNSYLEKKGLKKAVTYYGQVLGAAKAEQFKKAFLFLLPTNYPWEGQPLSIIEALAYSIPVITCQHKGIPELIQDGKNGFFVEPKSPLAIANTVIKITANPDLYSRMSHAARQHYENNFTREVHLRRLISAIMNIDEAKIPVLQF